MRKNRIDEKETLHGQTTTGLYTSTSSLKLPKEKEQTVVLKNTRVIPRQKAGRKERRKTSTLYRQQRGKCHGANGGG